MKSMMLTGIREMKMKEVPTPEVKNDTDVLVRVTRVGVCGSDIHYYTTGKIGTQVVQYPYPVGHEGAGIVEQVGDKVSKVKPGNRIAIEPSMPCWECDQCLAGRPHTCRNLKFLGTPGQSEGCLSEYMVMPETSCIPLQENLSEDHGSISEPLAIGVYAVRQSIPMKGAKVGILGAGPIGESVLAPALAYGAEKAYVTDRLDYRLDLARQNGAHWTGNPDKTDIVSEIEKEEPLLLDAVFEACGQQKAIDQAIDVLKPGGKLMIIGIPEISRWSMSVDKMRHKEITVFNVRRQNDSVHEALRLMSDRNIEVDNWVTHRFKFDQTKQAFDLVADYKDGVLKAMIDFD
jgi:L-iditol 2-dehydrogenase